MEDDHPVKNLNDGPVLEADLLLAGDVMRRRYPSAALWAQTLSASTDFRRRAHRCHALPGLKESALWTASHKSLMENLSIRC